MANLLAAENWTWIDGCDDLSNFDMSQINGDTVMSLLDDMQDDHELGYDHYHHDDDDERLMSVIKSLEAEIDQGRSHPTFNIMSELAVNVHADNNSFEDTQGRNYNIEDLQSRNFNGQDFVESNALDFSWMEMEMEMEMDLEMNFWNIENNYGQDYPCTVSFEENDCHSLWQEQNV
ncbi:putative heme-binding protein 2-like [Capsicum annuum]|nr:putative heme-binding protein 2-like [Capsicum annuum]KAF3660859.1 putative heme-binding protein 2-like [Capsicum annuum]